MRDARPGLGAHTPRGPSPVPGTSSVIARYSGHAFFPGSPLCPSRNGHAYFCLSTHPIGVSPRPWSGSHNQRPRSCSSFTSREALGPLGLAVSLSSSTQLLSPHVFLICPEGFLGSRQAATTALSGRYVQVFVPLRPAQPAVIHFLGLARQSIPNRYFA